MTLTTHAIASVVIAGYLPWPLLAFLVSMFVHYLMDIIPHGDEFLFARYVKNHKDRLPKMVATLDVLLMLALCYVFYLVDRTLPWYLVVSAALGGIMPDLLISLHTQSRNRFGKENQTALGRLEKIYNQGLQLHFKWHMWWHYLIGKTVRFRYGLAFQVILLFGLFWFHTHPLGR